MAEVNYEKMLFDRSARMLKVNGILSIVFGGLAALFVMVFFLVLVAGAGSDSPDASSYGVLSNVLVSFLLFIIGIAPCVYAIIAGVVLLKLPKPVVARTLLIINLIIGVFVNTVTLIFSIISLTQMRDYEIGYKHSR